MKWKEEIKSTAKYIIIGLLLSIFINQGLGYALHTEKPVMAVVSDSMVPTFYRGDLIVVKGINPEEIELGDIIVYQTPYKNIPIVHRVVAIEEKDGKLYFYTKGDHNTFLDQNSGIAPPVEEAWIKGKMILVIPKLGWFKIIIMRMI